MKVRRRKGYQEQRKAAYPSIEDQLDMIFNNGLEGWRATIDGIKKRYPKPKP